MSSKYLKTLRDVCIYNIVNTFDSYWYKPFEEQFGKSGKLLHVIGPFDDITSDLNQSIIDTLIKEKLMKTKYLQLLISSRLVELNLSQAASFVYSDGTVNTIADRCHKLLKLNLSWCSKISNKALESLVTELPQLQVLILKQTKCDDRVMCVISQHCGDLKHLDVSRCKITQRGLNFFCFDGKLLPCPHLSTLRIRDCDGGKSHITVDGVTNFISQRSKAVDVDYEKIHIVLRQFHKMNNSPSVFSPNLQFPRMQYLEFSHDEFVTEADVKLTCSYCPNITVAVLNPVTSNNQIQPLSALRHLRDLTIASDTHDGVTLSFSDGISTLLASVGHTLQKLKLYQMEVCLHTIGMYCPHLKYLELLVLNLQNNSSSFADDMVCYTELIEFSCFVLEENDFLPESLMSVVLNNASQLQRLSLVNVQFLTSDELGRYLNHGIKPDLENVQLTKCNHIGGWVIHQFLSTAYCLSKLNMEDCKMITRADFENIVRYCQQYRPQLQVTWT